MFVLASESKFTCPVKSLLETQYKCTKSKGKIMRGGQLQFHACPARRIIQLGIASNGA